MENSHVVLEIILWGFQQRFRIQPTLRHVPPRLVFLSFSTHNTYRVCLLRTSNCSNISSWASANNCRHQIFLTWLRPWDFGLTKLYYRKGCLFYMIRRVFILISLNSQYLLPHISAMEFTCGCLTFGVNNFCNSFGNCSKVEWRLFRLVSTIISR